MEVRRKLHNLAGWPRKKTPLPNE